VEKTTKKKAIFETLTEEIASGELAPGARMPSVRRLAERFGTSVYPVHEAMTKLRQQGYVVTQPRSGAYVADPTRPFQLSETVVLALETRSHVWGELDLMLTTRLHEDGLVPLTVRTDTEEWRERLISLARSEAQAIVIRGRRGFPYQMLQSPPFTDTVVVAVVEWFGPVIEGCLRVLSDFQEGGRRAARHLAERGHRNVLLVAPQWHQIVEEAGTCSGAMTHLHTFRQEWSSTGRRWQGLTLQGWEGREPLLDRNKLLAALDPEEFGATAVFGFMDVVVWKVQRILREERPEWLEDVELVGYFNTPWSEAAHPPFSSVDLSLESIAEETCELLEKALAEPESVEKPTRMITPRLVVRPGR
jgi:DNA-binding LacI/PurR family transcriptional regulator